MLRDISVGHLLVLLAIILLLFGGKRLPELARALGKSVSEFKKGRDEALAEPTDKPKEGQKETEKKDS